MHMVSPSAHTSTYHVQAYTQHTPPMPMIVLMITLSLGVTESIVFVPPPQKWILCLCLVGQRPGRSTQTTSGGTRSTTLHIPSFMNPVTENYFVTFTSGALSIHAFIIASLKPVFYIAFLIFHSVLGERSTQQRCVTEVSAISDTAAQ
jgi:hypothetical protein